MHPAMQNKVGTWSPITVWLAAGLILVIGGEVGALIALLSTSFIK